MFHVPRIAAPAAICILISIGCTAGRLLNEGKQFETAGDDWAAGQRYAGALNHDGRLEDARRGLNRVAKGAYQQQLARARAHEDRRAFPEALQAYKALDSFLISAKAHGALRFETIKVGDKVGQMRGAAAEQSFQQAEGFKKASRFNDAIAAYRRAEAFNGREYKGSRSRTAAAFAGLSNQLADQGRYRDAAAKALEADKLEPANTAHKERAAAIHLAIGRYFMNEGACRKAAVELDTAKRLVPRAVPNRDLRDVEACSQILVAVLPFDNRTRARVRGFTLEDNLADRLGGRIRGTASDFVRIAASAAGERRARVRVLGTITHLDIETERAPTTATINAKFKRTISCGSKEQKGVCTEEGTVRYRRYDQRSRIRLRGFVKVIDGDAQVAQIPFDDLEEDSVAYASNLTVSADELAEVEFHEPGESPLPLEGARKEMRSEAELLEVLTSRIVEALSPELVPLIDREPQVADPGRLSIEAI